MLFVKFIRVSDLNAVHFQRHFRILQNLDEHIHGIFIPIKIVTLESDFLGLVPVVPGHETTQTRKELVSFKIRKIVNAEVVGLYGIGGQVTVLAWVELVDDVCDYFLVLRTSNQLNCLLGVVSVNQSHSEPFAVEIVMNVETVNVLSCFRVILITNHRVDGVLKAFELARGQRVLCVDQECLDVLFQVNRVDVLPVFYPYILSLLLVIIRIYVDAFFCVFYDDPEDCLLCLDEA